MKTIKTWLATIALLLCSISANASDFEVNGLYYNILSAADRTVEMAGNGIYGDIIVPSNVKFNNIDFTVTRIGEYAFINGADIEYQITSVILPSTIKSIGSYAFQNCFSLKEIVIPEGVTRIEAGTFMQCGALEKIKLSTNISYIGEAAFQGCGISYIKLPPNCTIETNAFRYSAARIFLLQPWGRIEFSDYQNPFDDNTLFILRHEEMPADFDGDGIDETTLPSYYTYIMGGSGMSKYFDNIVSYDPDFTNAEIDYILETGGMVTLNGVKYRITSLLNTYTMEVFGSDYGITTADISSKINYLNREFTVTRIKESAFANNTALETVKIPNSITSIGNNAFAGCTALSKVTTESITPLSINDGCFDVMAQLFATLYVPVGAVETYKSATVWKGFGNIEAIANPSSTIDSGTYTSKGSELTWEFTSEGELKIEGVGSIPSIDSSPWAKYKNDIKRVVVGEGVKYITESAFKDCISLTSITIPESVTDIGIFAFFSCSALAEVHINSIEAWCKISFEDYFSNPLSYAHNLYLNEELVTKLEIPDTVTNIGKFSFAGCSLTSITIPQSVTSIGNNAFHSCSCLISVILPEGLTLIENSTFIYCNSLISIAIPRSVTSIGEDAFYGCINLSRVDFSEESELTKIGDRAFQGELRGEELEDGMFIQYYCSSLTSITIPQSVISIGNNAFDGCCNLIEVIIPRNSRLENIGEGAFANCEKLSSIIIPESVKSIGNYAFNACESLTDITIPESVTNMGDELFNGCSGLKHIVLNCSSVKSWFYYNGSIEMITLGEGVKSIESSAFAGCSGLLSVILPRSIEEIGTRSFANCYELTNVYCYSETVPSIPTDVFDGSYIEYATLYVPESSLEAYKSADIWKDFGEIKPIKKDAVINDAAQFFEKNEDEECASITYTRTFNNTNWQALYVPFEIPVTEEFLADFEVADLNDVRQYDRDDDGVKDETVIEAFKVKRGVLEANYPYLIRAREAGEKTITVTDATLYATEENSIDCSSVREKFTFTGTYSQLFSEELPHGEGYYALSGGVWQPVAEGASLGAFRFYLKVDSRNNLNAAQGNAIRMRIIGEDGEEDDATGIDNSEFKTQNSELIFDLQGRRVKNLTKGVYIVNGVKRVF